MDTNDMLPQPEHRELGHLILLYTPTRPDVGCQFDLGSSQVAPTGCFLGLRWTVRDLSFRHTQQSCC